MHNHSTPASEASKGVADAGAKAPRKARSSRRSSTPLSAKRPQAIGCGPVPLRACVAPKVTADSPPIVRPDDVPATGPAEGAVTEIPEHLLRRSRERREALGLSTGDAGAGAAPPAAPSTEVQPAAAAAIPGARACPSGGSCGRRAAAQAPASLRRGRAAPQAHPVLGDPGRRALLPIWAFIYQWSLTPPTQAVTGPLAAGQELYTGELRVVPPPHRRRRLGRRHRLPAEQRLGAADLP